MSNDLINRVLEHSKQKGTDRTVAIILAHQADKNGHINPDLKIVADLAATDPRNVRLAIQKLRAAGELTPSSQGGYLLSPEKSRGEVTRRPNGELAILGADQVIHRQRGSRDPGRGSRDPQKGSGDPKSGSGDPPSKDLKLTKTLLTSKRAEGEKQKTAAAPSRKLSDARGNHPAIQAVRALAQCYPPKGIWDDLIAKLGEQPDTHRLRECFLTWISSNSRKPTNFAWAREWYLPGVLESKRGNFNAPHLQSSSASNRPDAGQLTRDLELKRQRDDARPATH